MEKRLEGDLIRCQRAVREAAGLEARGDQRRGRDCVRMCCHLVTDHVKTSDRVPEVEI